jgi:hypothetical protein
MRQCVSSVQEEVIYAGKSKRKYQRISSVAGGVASSAMQAGALGGLCGTVPILAIILPIVLPLVALVAKSGKDRWRYKAEGVCVIAEGRFNTDMLRQYEQPKSFRAKMPYRNCMRLTTC